MCRFRARKRVRECARGTKKAPGRRFPEAAFFQASEPEGSAQDLPCERSHCRNLSVAKGFKSVHPVGHPIRSSTQYTVGQQPVAVSTKEAYGGIVPRDKRHTLATIPLHPQGTGGVPPDTPCVGTACLLNLLLGT